MNGMYVDDVQSTQSCLQCCQLSYLSLAVLADFFWHIRPLASPFRRGDVKRKSEIVVSIRSVLNCPAAVGLVSMASRLLAIRTTPK